MEIQGARLLERAWSLGIKAPTLGLASEGHLQAVQMLDLGAEGKLVWRKGKWATELAGETWS